MQSEKLPDNRHATLRVVPMPADTNAAGNIFGGWLMSQVDIAGSIVAIRRAQGPVTTVAVTAFRFHKPVYVGDVVSLYAEVMRVGTTSVTVDIVVYAERGLRQSSAEGTVEKVAEATLAYVAIDADYRKRPVPPEVR
ncbi:MAG: acyl-CoA thioesterase [Pseudomonadota bacterium]